MTIHQKRLLRYFNINIAKYNRWIDVPLSNKEKIKLIASPKDFSEVRVTSGSTGSPLYVFYSKKAVDLFIKRTVISLRKSSVSKKDVVLNLFAYGNYIPGSMYERACQIEGIPVIPFGAPNTYSKEKVIEAIRELRPNVWFSVPSYAIALLDILARAKRNNDFPEKIIIAGERILDVYIKKFKKYKIQVVNHFGLTECPAIGVSNKIDLKTIEVINVGIHVESMRYNGVSYLVISDVFNYAMPIIRYKTGDIIENSKYNKNGTLVQFSIVGRDDDLIKIQGMLVSKTKIIDTLSKFTDAFMVSVTTRNSRDFVVVTLDSVVKKEKDVINNKLDFLKKRKLIFKKRFSVPVTSSFKYRHIIDLRK